MKLFGQTHDYWREVAKLLKEKAIFLPPGHKQSQEQVANNILRLLQINEARAEPPVSLSRSASEAIPVTRSN